MKFIIPKNHDDINGESIARVWHKLAEAISIVVAIGGIGITLTAAAGAIWHGWAAEQHAHDAERLKGIK